jgi:hypothetical protein
MQTINQSMGRISPLTTTQTTSKHPTGADSRIPAKPVSSPPFDHYFQRLLVETSQQDTPIKQKSSLLSGVDASSTNKTQASINAPSKISERHKQVESNIQSLLELIGEQEMDGDTDFSDLSTWVMNVNNGMMPKSR